MEQALKKLKEELREFWMDFQLLGNARMVILLYDSSS
jgi:hypothetical protein